MPKPNFEKIVGEAVDTGLSSLGKSSKQAIYFHLEKTFGLKTREIPYKMEDFAHGIEKIFGMGAGFLEILIMKRIHEQVGLTIQLHQCEDLAFLEYVAAAKQRFLEKQRAKRKRRELKKHGK